MESLSISLEFLIQAIRLRVEGHTSTTLFEKFDEQGVLELAKYHNVLPWLWLYIDEFSAGSAEFRKHVADALRKDSLKNQLQTRELALLSRELSDHDIDHLVLKGLSVEQLFYKGFVDTRYSDDIDLLVLPSELSIANEVVLANDYGLRKQQDIDKLTSFLRITPSLYRWRDIGYEKTRNSKVKIDMHWRIADGFTLPVSTQSLLGRNSTVRVGDINIPCLPFTHLFVYVCVHGYTDYFFRLRYLVDIYCAMQQPKFNLSEVNELAKKWGVSRSVECSIATVNHFFQDGTQRNAYSNLVVKRYSDSNGFPRRSHPSRQHWTSQDRRRYLLHQIGHRSDNSSWYEPLLARCKYNESMVDEWPERISPWLWYPAAVIRRLLLN